MELLEQDYTDRIKQIARNTKNKDVLDVGCGSGFYTSLFCNNGNKVYATDIQDRTVIPYKGTFEFALSSEKKLNYPDAKFDLVVSFDVIEHVKDDVNFLKEIKRVLKPNGVAIVATPNKLRIVNLVKLILLKKPFKYPLFLGNDPVLGDCVHLREYSAQHLESVFKEAGFCSNKIEKFWFGVRIKKLDKLRILKMLPPLNYFSQYLFACTKHNALVSLNAFWDNGKGMSGGDQIAKQVFKRIGNSFNNVLILTSNSGYKLFEQIPNAKHIGHGKFIESQSLGVSYIFRTLIGIVKLQKIKVDTIYAGSDFFPDVVPLFIFKLKNPRALWCQAVFHMYPYWRTRAGSKTRAFLGYYLQKASLLLIKRADRIICINTQVKNELINKGFKKEQLILIYPGIDNEELSKVESSKEKYEATFLARLNPSKGIYDLLKIWKLVCNKIPGAKLAIIGGGSNETVELLKKEIANNKLTNNIKVLGFLENQEAFGLIKSSSVFIFPSHEEGFGIAVAEAMACGVPAIAWNLSVYNEIFGNTVIKVKENNLAEFAEEIIAILRNPTLRDRISRKGLDYIKKYSWDNVAGYYLKCLTKT